MLSIKNKLIIHPVIASIQILIKAQNKSRSVEENLITGIYESLCDSLMKVVYNLSIRDNSTFEELTPQEKELWKKFKTDDNSRFFTSEPDTVPKFCSDWTSIPRLTFQVRFTSSPDQAPAVQPPQAAITTYTSIIVFIFQLAKFIIHTVNIGNPTKPHHILPPSQLKIQLPFLLLAHT
jgi:hypothetical protein